MVLLVVLLIAMGFSHLFYPCSPDERAVLTEFPQYGGEKITDANEGLDRGCSFLRIALPISALVMVLLVV